MEIFEATIFDLPSLSALFDEYRQFYKQRTDVTGAEKFLRERIVSKDSVIYVAVDDKGLLHGFVQCYPLFTSVGMKKSWLLNDLYVIKKSRGKGTGRMLVERCKELAIETGANGLMLETAKLNAEGNALYPSCGFDLMEKSNFYFWKNK